MKKIVLAAFLALLGAGLAAQIALAVEEDVYEENVDTTWGCIKRIYSPNPCPEPVDKNA